MSDHRKKIEKLLEASRILMSDTKPSEWNEKNRVMTSEVSPFPGPFSYRRSPYAIEIVNRLSANDPARVIAFKKGAQVGGSTGIIEAGIGWIISENPGNILFLTGHADLADEAMNGKIDQMLDSTGLRPLIKPNVLRKKNMRTGDTNKSKEFPGGSLVAGSAGNHKLLRQRSVMYGFIDDFDAAKQSTDQSGSTKKMIEQRFAAYAQKMKLFYISTPELKQTSNIEPAYLAGDQRKFFIPCPCCGSYINIEWSIPLKDSDGEMAGISYDLDENGELVPGSVGYICQECGDKFDDSRKLELLNAGEWRPTTKPSKPGYYSYHLSSLYAPPGMYDWEHYVRDYIYAYPVGQPIRVPEAKAFTNLCLGETWEDIASENKASDLMKNMRSYDIGIVPESVSQKDGNGKIVLLVLACDLNGKIDDARLDYEVVAWSEAGPSYSVEHGSIGTFIPRENNLKRKEDRVKWSYQKGKPNCVWTEFDKIKNKIWDTDNGRKMRIMITGVDTGYSYDGNAYDYVDGAAPLTVSLKGKDKDKFVPIGRDVSTFKYGKERPNLFLVENLALKDELARRMKLKWDEDNDAVQPSGFINFPQPSKGLYGFQNYFLHFEAEHRVVKQDSEGNGLAARWEKKTSVTQNHFYDVHLYAMALRDIMVALICKDLKQKPMNWHDFVLMFLGKNATVK